MSAYVRDLRARLGSRLLLLPSVATVIPDEHDRLLLQRKGGGEGWRLPAGGIEPGESPEAALHREVLETASDVSPARAPRRLARQRQVQTGH